MYKSAILLLLLSLKGSDAINIRDKIHQQAAQTKWGRKCSINIDNFKSQQSLDYSSIAEQGWQWTDPLAFAYNNQSKSNDWFYWDGQSNNHLKNNNKIGYDTYWLHAMSTPAIEHKSMYGSDLKDFNDISQGLLGNCYYLAGISAVAENRYRLQHTIVTDTLNDAGIFTMRVYIKGVPATISVDDYIPFEKNRWREEYYTQFAKAGKDNSIWGMLMEKVWAKINGNYEFTAAGSAIEVYEFIGGCPVITYKTTDKSGINQQAQVAFDIAINGEKRNYMMSCGCCNKDTNNAAVDIFPNHAYSVLGAVTVQRYGEEVKLLLLRNPWGSQTFNGTWGATNYQNMWDQETNWQAPQYAQESGNFYITAAEFVYYFDGISVGFFIDTYVNNFLEVRMCDVRDSVTRTYYVTFDQDAGETQMGVNFYNVRMYPRDNSKQCNTDRSYTIITVKSESGTQLYNEQVWHAAWGFKYFNVTSLAAGTYTMTVQTFWSSDVDVPDYAVRVYTDQKVTIGAATGQYGSWNYAIDRRNGTASDSDPNYSPPTACVGKGENIVPYKPMVFTPAESAVEPAWEPTVEPEIEPAWEPTVESEVEPTVKPTVESEVEPAWEPTVEPEVEPAWEPTVESEVLPPPREPTVQTPVQRLSEGLEAFENNLPQPTYTNSIAQYFNQGMTTSSGYDGWFKYTGIDNYKSTITLSFPNNGGYYATKGDNTYCYGDSSYMTCHCTIEGSNDSCKIAISGLTWYYRDSNNQWVQNQWDNNNNWW